MPDGKNIDVLLKELRTFPPPEEFSRAARIGSMDEYRRLYRRSMDNPGEFWSEMADKHLSWHRRWDSVFRFDPERLDISWFQGGKLNAAYNCIDRHTKTPARNKAAIIWEADDGTYRTLTYQQLHYEVNRFANVLKKHGIRKGDRVTIYLPMIPELAISMLACARIGAIHSIVFGGFSSQALGDRIRDCGARLLITADSGIRGGKPVPLKERADSSLENSPSIEKMIVVKRAAGASMQTGRDFWWHEEMAADDIGNYCEPEWMDSEDPLFILYTSGSTGRPKGVLHTTAGYLLYSNLTFQWIFDYRDEDIFFCTADIGWITGHSYIVYGPLSAGATTLMFEGVPTYPHPGRLWEIVDRHQVNIIYTAPTVIRSLMREGDKWVSQYDLSTLRLLGSVGEPINPEAWIWYHSRVGKGKLPIVDTWWQTETGGILISPLPGAMTLKPGSAGMPFPGVSPAVLREDGSRAGVNEGGYLVVDKPWPGMIRGTYGDTRKERFREVYFSKFPGTYLSGDGARVDAEGDYWLIGRIDDVINTAGHRIGTAEIESAMVSYEAVSEAAVVGFPHSVKGEGIYVYVVLKEGIQRSGELQKALVAHIRQVIGPIATPDKLQFTDGLPKTRSGKIMRRILRKIACGQIDEIGDTSTLADPSVLDILVKERL